MASDDHEAKRATRGEAREAKRAAWHEERSTGEQEVREAIREGAREAVERMTRIGRPTVISPDLEAVIIERVSHGESLASMCAEEGMPAVSTVQRWAARTPSFAAALAHAREAQADVLWDQVVAIADDDSRDLLPTDKGVTSNPAAVARAKLRIETRLRVAAQIAPHRYAERAQQVTVTGPVTVNALSVDARAMSPEARERLRTVLLEAKALPAVTYGEPESR